MYSQHSVYKKSKNLIKRLVRTATLITGIIGLNYTTNAEPIKNTLTSSNTNQQFIVRQNYPYEEIYETKLGGNAQRATISGEAFLPIKERLFLDGKLAEDTKLGLNATLGLGHRARSEDRTYGINIFTDLSDKQTTFSLGFETFSSERRLNLHGNVYAGNQKTDEEESINYTGADITAVARVLDKDKLALNGILGAYFFQTDREEKASITGAKGGFEIRIPLRKNSWEIITDLMSYSEKELEGANYTASIGIRYGKKVTEFEPVRRQTPYFEIIKEETKEKEIQPPKKEKKTPTHTGDPETPNPTHEGD